MAGPNPVLKMTVGEALAKARAAQQPRTVNVNHARIGMIGRQIEQLTPLLQSDDPEIRLRTSAEIRELHEQINKCNQLINDFYRINPHKQPTPKPYVPRKYKKRVVVPVDENEFRPK